MDKLLYCLKELENLKTVKRGARVCSRQESTAEHSWSCMLIADILLPFVEETIDRLKVLEILLYHDIVEVYAGDAKFNNPEEMKKKKELEAMGYQKIISIIPNSKRYENIIEEYEARKTRESKFAKAIDCMDALIRAYNDDRRPKDEGFTQELISSKYKKHVQEFEFIDALFERIMNILVEQDKI